MGVKEQKKQLNNAIVGWNNNTCKSEQGSFICPQKKQVLEDLLMPVDGMQVGPMKLHNNNNNIAEQLMPTDSMKVRPMKLQNNNKSHRTADANQHMETRANESPEQQQNCRAANAN